MKKNVLLLSIMLLFMNILRAQEKTNKGFFLGGYYTFLVDPVILEETADTIKLRHNYINLNVRYALSHKWRIGAEYIFVLTSPDEVDDPFYIAGLTVDYDILRTERSKLHLRAGLSVGNLSFAGDYEPKKKFIINRVLGASYEFRITKLLWIYAGLYNHHPFNKILYKYSIAQPFIGINIGLSKPKVL